MIHLRPAATRGHADHGWLRTWHSFSFADYYDPAEMGWGPLRVLNEDLIAPARGFPQHGHRDMEIITYLLAGPLEHTDSMGNGSVIRPPEVQRMSAGRGVLHSEFNPSPTETVHLLQIWIEPAVSGGMPSYEQKHFDSGCKRGRWCPIATPDGRDGSLTIQQDACVFARKIGAGETASLPLAPGRRAYLHLVNGRVRLDGLALESGDGAKIAEEGTLTLAALADSEMLWFDLP